MGPNSAGNSAFVDEDYDAALKVNTLTLTLLRSPTLTAGFLPHTTLRVSHGQLLPSRADGPFWFAPVFAQLIVPPFFGIQFSTFRASTPSLPPHTHLRAPTTLSP